MIIISASNVLIPDSFVPASRQPTPALNVASNGSAQIWHSGLSRHPYEVVLLPNNVLVCYDCHNKFSDS